MHLSRTTSKPGMDCIRAGETVPASYLASFDSVEMRWLQLFTRRGTYCYTMWCFVPLPILLRKAMMSLTVLEVIPLRLVSETLLEKPICLRWLTNDLWGCGPGRRVVTEDQIASYETMISVGGHEMHDYMNLDFKIVCILWYGSDGRWRAQQFHSALANHREKVM